MMPDWQGKLQPTTMLQACNAGRRRGAALLLSSQAAHRRQLPHVPGRVWHALPSGRIASPCSIRTARPKIARSVLPYEPGTPRGAIACATPISPGMEIYPSSPATKQMREAVLESLLINHPLDCPICDQAGECKLQEYSLEYGKSKPAALPRKRFTSPSRWIWGRASCWTMSAASFAPAAFVSLATSWATTPWAFSIAAATARIASFPGATVRQQLHAQHRGYLPGGRSDFQRFPLPNARVVSQRKQEHLHQLRHRLQHRHRLPREQSLSATNRAKTMRSIPAGCAITAG